MHKNRTILLEIHPPVLLILYFPPSLNPAALKTKYFFNFAICKANHMADNAGEDPGRRSHKELVEKRTAASRDITVLAQRTPPAVTPCKFPWQSVVINLV